MATLSQLVSVFSQVSGLHQATAFAYGRFAREGGVIAQGGRGRSASKMCATDAANLLIAVGGTATTRNAARAVEEYRAMRGFAEADPDLHDVIGPWLEKAGFNGVNKYVRFGTFAEFLISEAGSGELVKFLKTIPCTEVRSSLVEEWRHKQHAAVEEQGLISRKSSEQTRIGEDVVLRLDFVRSRPEVRVTLLRKWGTIVPILTAVFHGRSVLRELRSPPRDLSVTAVMTQNTVLALGLTIADVKLPRNLRADEDFANFFSNLETSGSEGAAS